MNWYKRVRNFFYYSSFPATKGLIVTFAAIFICTFFLGLFGFDSVLNYFTLDPSSIGTKPWSLFTYALFNRDPLSLVFNALILWFFGGSLEIIWGTRRYLYRLIFMTVVTGIFLWLGMLLRPWAAAGFYPVATAMVVAWAIYNSDQTALLGFVFPVQGKWLGIISVFLLFFSFPFPLGFFSLSGCGYAYYIAHSRGKSAYYKTKGSWWSNFKQNLRRKHLRRIK